MNEEIYSLKRTITLMVLETSRLPFHSLCLYLSPTDNAKLKESFTVHINCSKFPQTTSMYFATLVAIDCFIL